MGDETECATEKTTKKYVIAGDVDSTMWEFGFAQMGQETQRSCWFAAFRILYQWGKEQGKSVSPDDVQRLVTAGTFAGVDADFQTAIQNGLDKDKRRSAYTDVALSTFDRATVLGWSLQDIVTKVHASGPMIFTRAVDQGGGNFTTHAMVIRGASVPMKQVYILDPYDDSALNGGGAPYRALTTIWSYADYQSNFPPDGSISADTLIGQFP